MNFSFLFMILTGFLYAAICGNTSAVALAAVEAGADAVDTVLSLLGGFMFFGGVTRILEKAGVTAYVVRGMRRPLRCLFGADTSDEALGAVTMNLSANMLGMGNAATPMGLKAAKLLGSSGDEKASAALCLLLVLNSTCIELFPSTVVSLRYAANSANATAIVLPTLLSTLVSSIVGVLLCKACEWRNRK